MDVFVFEYATFVNDMKFIAEGKAMLNLIINGLKKDKIYDKIYTETSNTKRKLHSNFCKKMLEKARNFDYVILIAPNYELLKISNYLKQYQYVNSDIGKFLISQPDALDKTLNKFKLYENLSSKIPLPKTMKFSDFDEDINFINFPIIIKPIYGTGCESTYVFMNDKGYKHYGEKYYKEKYCGERQKFNENFIVQEFIDGIHTSVCLFAGKKIYPVSLNLQHIKFKSEGKNVMSVNYIGGQVPFFNKLKEKVFEYAKIACKHLNLKGYIGMDFVIDNKNEKLYLIEINPRITTSAIALSKAANLNIARLHIACFKDEEILKKELSEVKFSYIVEILKYENKMLCRVKDKI